MTAELAAAATELDTAIDGMAAVLNGVAGDDPAGLADGQLVVTLYRLQAKLGAVVARAAAAFDRSEAWRDDGARNAVSWLAVTARLPKSQLKRDVRLGRAVTERLPACGDAWAAGDIAEAHVATLCSLAGGRAEAQLSADEAMLVEQAETLPFGEFRQAAAYWEQLADPDGCDATEEQRRCRRDVALVESMDGMWLGQMTLDPVSGCIVAGELTRLEQQLFDTDWAAARERLGRDPMAGDLERTARQRRADALVEMATRSRSTPPGSRRPRPLFTVLVDWPTAAGRVCELASGQVVAPGALVRWLTEADFERVVFGPDSRIEVGRTARLFTGASRRAIEVRDRICAHPFCDEPVGRCQGDHIEPYEHGGPTVIDNGRLLCPFHNRLRSKGRRPGRAPSHRAASGPAPPTDPVPPTGWAPPGVFSTGPSQAEAGPASDGPGSDGPGSDGPGFDGPGSDGPGTDGIAEGASPSG